MYTIGESDYSRQEIESNSCGWTWGSINAVLEAIKEAESNGYDVIFKTSLLRRIFCLGKYKIIAKKQQLWLVKDCGI